MIYEVKEAIEWAKEYSRGEILVDEIERLRGVVKSQSAIIDSAAASIPAQWTDKPDGDGWYWATDAGSHQQVNLGWVYGDSLYFHGGLTRQTTGAERMWLRIPTPTPPVKLPKSREVTMTAKVMAHRVGRNWLSERTFDGNAYARKLHASKAEAVHFVRENYGIEPVIEGEEVKP